MDKTERAEERRQMVLTQLITRGIQSAPVLEAMQNVPRHRFIPKELQDNAYDDGPLPIGENQTISQPYIVALMTEYAQPTKESKALEIGTGSGYAAAVLGEICKEVYTIERIPELAEVAKARLKALGYTNIHCLEGDGTLGVLEYAPYDCITVTAGAPVVPASLKQQLAVGGVMVIPVGERGLQQLLCIKRVSEDEFDEFVVEAVRFVPLIGKEGW